MYTFMYTIHNLIFTYIYIYTYIHIYTAPHCTGDDVTSVLSLFRAADPTKRLPLKHWEAYIQVCASGFSARELAKLAPFQVYYVLDTLPACIYAQLDAAAVAFLARYFGLGELEFVLGASAPVAPEVALNYDHLYALNYDHPLALLDRYSLESVKDQVCLSLSLSHPPLSFSPPPALALSPPLSTLLNRSKTT